MTPITKYPKSWLLKFLVLAAVIAFSLYILEQRRVPDKPTKLSRFLPKESYKRISPLSYKYLLNQPDLCQNRSPFLVLMIPVAPQDSESRTAIRRTWGQESLVRTVDVARVFFIGEPRERDPKLEENLREESATYRDIVQMDFLDTYHNLTIKTMMIMNWLANCCRSARYAMKIDTDIFLNVPYLVEYLRDKPSHNYITGSVIADGRPRRNPNSKWYLPEMLYPEDSFPPYVSGAGYVFSVDLAKKVSMASRFVRPIPMEDVYVGLCLRFLSVRPEFARTLLPYKNLFEIRYLDYDRCTFAERIIVTGYTPTMLTSMWTDFQSADYSC